MGVGGRPSINVIRGKKVRGEESSLSSPFFLLFLSSRRVLRIPSARILFGTLATSEKPPKGSLETKRDVIHHSPVHRAPSSVTLARAKTPLPKRKIRDGL